MRLIFSKYHPDTEVGNELQSRTLRGRETGAERCSHHQGTDDGDLDEGTVMAGEEVCSGQMLGAL